MTHGAEYKVFMRECRNRSKMPVSLTPVFENDKTDLFNLWLKSDKSLDAQQSSVILEIIDSQSCSQTIPVFIFERI